MHLQADALEKRTETMATTQTESSRPSRGLLRSMVVWPIVLAWRIATFTVDRTGILLGLILGLGLMMVGWLICTTFVGFFIGFPMAAFGFMLLIRALY